jgi:hypothetical protein
MKFRFETTNPLDLRIEPIDRSLIRRVFENLPICPLLRPFGCPIFYVSK